MKSRLAPTLLFFTAICFSFCLQARADITTLVLQQPLDSGNSANIDTVRYTWLTSLTSGIMNTGDVDFLKMELYSGGVKVYSDRIISGGVLQDFGGAARNASDVFFSYDLDADLLLEARNVNTAQSGSLGEQFYVEDLDPYNISNRIGIFRFFDGVQTSNNGYNDLVSSQSSAIPEPGTGTLIAALSTGALLARRRKR